MAYTQKLSDGQKDVMLNKLAEIANELTPGVRKQAGLSVADKERVVNALLADPTGRGFKRVA